MDVTLDGRRVAVGKILCVGRNYEDHAREMGATAPRSELAAAPPFFFLKPSTALVPSGGLVRIPRGIGEVHHEVELAVLVKTNARNVAPREALAHVAGYAAFLDITARDLQAAAKKAGLPWTVAKGMDTFAPCGPFVSTAEGEPDWDVELAVNGSVRQRGRTTGMIHGVASLLSHASRAMTLEAGDILATGTPAGVGPIRPGDSLDAKIGPLPPLSVRVVEDTTASF